jgi:hypothetical protein
MGEIQPLSYSTLPTNWGISCNETEDGVVLIVPDPKWKFEAGIVFALSALVICACMFLSILIDSVVRSPRDLLVVIVIAGWAFLLLLRSARRAGPKEIALKVASGNLSVIRRSKFSRRVEKFEITVGLAIEARRFGLRTHDRNRGELVVSINNLPVSFLFYNDYWSRLDWIARMLNQAIERQRNRQAERQSIC